MKRQEGGRIWVPGQPHWALLRAVWKEACFFLLVTMRCHTDLSCLYGNQVGKGLVCLCTKGNASFSIKSPDDAVLQDRAGGSVVSDPPLAPLWQEHLIENEVSILRRVKHPNIIMLVEEMETATELFLVMELVKVRGWRDFKRVPWCHIQRLTVFLKEKCFATLKLDTYQF